MTLPPKTPLPLPAPTERWHVHGSPPCGLVSRANRRTRTQADIDEGVALVRWYIDLALSCGATTWSMEQVATEDIKRVLRSYRLSTSPHRNIIDWDVFNFKNFGIPQCRRRIIAGSPEIIARLRRTPKKQCGVDQFIQHPRGTHIRNESLYRQGSGPIGRAKRRKMGPDEMCRPITGPSYTVVASKPLRWATPGSGTSLQRLTPHESASIQAFPPGYALPEVATTATRAVGNAIPPPIVTQFLNRGDRPVSPSLRWHNRGVGV